MGDGRGLDLTDGGDGEGVGIGVYIDLLIGWGYRKIVTCQRNGCAGFGDEVGGMARLCFALIPT